MLMDAARWLRESGLTVEDLTPADGADAGVDAILEVEIGDRSVRFVVQAKSRAPYPHELERLKESWHGPAGRGHPLIVAPFISEPLGSILTREGWSWADAQGNFDLRAPGLLLRQRRTSTPPARKRKTLPRGSGSFAVIRALVGFRGAGDEGPRASALAAQAGVSQPRASQVLHSLHELELVDRSGHGRWEPRREALLDRFLAEYPGLILAWRRPSLVILYAKHAIDPSGLGLTQAQGRHDANVIMRTPQDRSVFPAPALMVQVQGRAVPLADLLQQIWDLQDLGGADRIEAAGRLRQWLLERPLPDLRSVPPRLPMISAMSRSATWHERSETFPQISVSSAATWSRCWGHDGDWGTSSTERPVT